MTRAELRRQMRERKRALRAELARRRAGARAQVARLPAVRKARRRRRLRRGAVLGALLLLALFVRCDCAEAVSPPPTAPAEVSTAAPPARAKAVAKGKVPPQPLKGTVPSQPRGKLRSEARPAPSWLEDFHLQVSARSPRLAECFSGADRPGALRWAASLNAKSGAVSDHELEPLGGGADLDGKQRQCLIRVLSSPSYRLKVADGEPLPNRVGLVIEF